MSLPFVRGQAGAATAVSGGIVCRTGLFQRLDRAARVVEVAAPAGSGKTVLLRSWIGEAGLSDRTAWVTARPEERDPQWFWISVADALRGTAPGSTLVRPVTAAPGLDGWAIIEGLLKDLAALEDRIWLFVDDVHELRSADAGRQLELLIMRAPAELRFVLATRHDLGLGLHRLRLEGGLAEIREPDLRFTTAEAAELFAAAGVDLPEVAPLVERTEGWRPGCGWRRCRWPGTRTRRGSWPGFPVASGRWPSTCWPRCSGASRGRSGGCCCAPRFSSRSTASWLTC
jgi:LuxR family maltose regulon positive regulatory protein